MSRKESIENQIYAALASIDHLVKAEPAPFFYTRVAAKWSRTEKSIWERASRVITRPVIAGFVIATIILVNAFAIILHGAKDNNRLMPDQAEIAVADEYSRNTNFYYIDNVQP